MSTCRLVPDPRVESGTRSQASESIHTHRERKHSPQRLKTSPICNAEIAMFSSQALRTRTLRAGDELAVGDEITASTENAA
jgi:hypothetical protein